MLMVAGVCAVAAIGLAGCKSGVEKIEGYKSCTSKGSDGKYCLVSTAAAGKACTADTLKNINAMKKDKPAACEANINTAFGNVVAAKDALAEAQTKAKKTGLSKADQKKADAAVTAAQTAVTKAEEALTKAQTPPAKKDAAKTTTGTGTGS